MDWVFALATDNPEIRSDSESWPPCPFWDFSIALYSDQEVAGVCLELQDEYGVDVNLFLFAIWAGAIGGCILNADFYAELMDETREWRQSVIEPLREVRRKVKHLGEADGKLLDLDLYKNIKQLELHFERFSQLKIWQFYARWRCEMSETHEDENARQLCCRKNAELLFEVMRIETGPHVQTSLSVVIQSAMRIANC